MKRPNELLRSLAWRDEVGHFLNTLGLVGRGVEVGSCEGRYAVQILSGTSNHGRWRSDCNWAWKGHLICVDLWERQPDDVYLDSANLRNMTETHDKAMRALSPYRATLLKMHSLEAAKQFPDATLDWVYIDANHAYQATADDIKAWYPKVRSGGLFSGHDFYTCIKLDHPNVVERTDSNVAIAVLEFAEMLGVWPHVTACRSWWFVKP